MNKAFEHQLGIPFDQYQRYKIVSDIVNKYRCGDGTFRILEIGASYEENLKHFLPDDNIYFLDIDYPEEYKQIKNYIIGDITKIELKDEYDFIVSIDCYEHILPNLRTTYVEKLIGQSRKATVIAAPFDTTGVKETEVLLNNLYRLQHGEDHRWLKEHIENGLPSLSQTIRIIEDLGFNNYTILPNGYLARWFKMMSVILMAGGGAEYLQILKSLSELYNHNFYKYDNTNPAYRQVIVISKNSDVPDFKDLLSKDTESDPDFKSRSDILQSVIERFETLFRNNEAVNEPDGQIADLNQAAAEREGQITSLNQALAERDAQINNLNQSLTERDAQIATLYHSTSWRITWPLRIIGHQLKRFRRVAELAMLAIQRGGGLKSMLKKAIQLYRREGLAGIKRGFRIVAAFGFDRNDCAAWIRRYDTLTDETRATMRDRIDNFVRKPLISLVMPTYNPKPEWLIEAIESIRKQIYPCWELCIADDASTDKRIRPILERYAREDTRIRVVFREKNGHISAASNSALELATGEWVALLDQDDLLAEHALLWVADAINRHPQARMIYSDEDKINESGKRFDPYFKCDWNVDLFYSHNLIAHLGVYHAALLRDLGGFRLGFEGSQDYDIALRCIEHIEPNQIHHIPRILYHWRAHAKSTALAVNAKPFALRAGEKALSEHFRRQGVNANAELLDIGMYRIRFALPDVLPLVSLIIPTRNSLHLIQRCVESILEKTNYPNYEIMIVDNGSNDPATLQYFKELQFEPRVRVVRDDRPFNYSALNNSAVKIAHGDLVGLVNNDIEVISPDWLSEMVSHALRPGVGAVGARLWYPNNTLQHGGVIIGLGGVAGHSHKHLPKEMPGYFWRANLIQNYSAVTASCLVIRKSVYEEVGGFNEVDLQVAFNDVDFCLRVGKAGYRNIWTPYAELYHHESATRGLDDSPEKQARFDREVQYMKRRFGDQLLNDPAYSPNLTLDREDFSLGWPPRVEMVPPARSST